jgi:hypothetical protein
VRPRFAARAKAGRRRARWWRVGREHVFVGEFDQLADHYDETRGGEGRGDEYAADIDALLPPDEGPILEV